MSCGLAADAAGIPRCCGFGPPYAARCGSRKEKKKKKQMDDLQGKIMVLEATVQNNQDERRALPER